MILFITTAVKTSNPTSVYLITGFGICSTFWDKIFGTEIALRKLSRALKW
jgi:hypothetical protein